MAFLTGSRFINELKKIREQGELEPIQFGFDSWQDYDNGQLLQASKGSTILIGGEPHHGKTYFTNEIVMQLIEKHNFKVAIMSSETGKTAKIFSMFYGLFIGKAYSKVRPDLKENFYAMTDQEKAIAESFINQHLYVFQVDRKKTGYQTLENIYKELQEAENHYDIKFDSLVIDPIYDIDDFKPKADDVKQVLSRINYECEINNRVDIIVNHVSETTKIVGKDGTRRKLRALADEFYGGKNNQRKAMLQLLVERPMPNTNPEEPDDYIPENQTNIHVLKAKPEGVAFLGVYPIFYDWQKRRYYENHNENIKFANCTRFKNEAPNEPIKVQDVLVDPQDAFNTENDDLPF